MLFLRFLLCRKYQQKHLSLIHIYIGPSAGMPVMEGKCALFKAFAGIDAVPICINSKDPDEIVNTVYLISKSFGGINLEDISAPRCFEIEKRLIEMCDKMCIRDRYHSLLLILIISAYAFILFK